MEGSGFELYLMAGVGIWPIFLAGFGICDIWGETYYRLAVSVVHVSNIIITIMKCPF